MMIRESSKASGLADGERRGGGDVVGESKRTESFLAETLTGAAPHAATDAGAELLRPLLDVEDRLNLQMQGSSDTTIEPTPADGSSCLSENAGIRSNLSLVKGSGTAGDEAGVTLAPAVGGEDRQASHINADMVPHTHPTNGEFLLEEAIDDGTVVKTAGTILFTLLEVTLTGSIQIVFECYTSNAFFLNILVAWLKTKRGWYCGHLDISDVY